MNPTLTQHGIEDTATACIFYAGRRQAQNNWEGWVVACKGRTIASGFNNEAKAVKWAKARGMEIELEAAA